MTSVQYRRYGGPEELRLEEVALPEPGRGQLLLGPAGVDKRVFSRLLELRPDPGTEILGDVGPLQRRQRAELLRPEKTQA